MKKIIKKLFFPVFGFLSLCWFLIRVIPKPSRASYPCMRATAPLASSFVVWVTGLFASVLFFKKARKFLFESRYILFSLACLAILLSFLVPFLQDAKPVRAIALTTLDGPNQPMGIGQGIHPGQVVWVHNPDATDETCRNSNGDYWYQDNNTNQDVVNQMVSDGLQKMTGEATDAAAWDAIFRYYNASHSKGNTGYSAGEKFVIKINLNGMYNSRADRNINTSPQIAYTVLHQLIDVVGVAQEDISIGDPNVTMPGMHYDKLHTAFPNVIYWGEGPGLTQPEPSDKEVIFSSDNEISDVLPQCYLDAAYMINLPVLKKHHRAGISLCCKNHFGSTAPFYGGAWQWHYSLPCPDATGDAVNGDYGTYRCFVDIMGHPDLGGKTILYLVDGLWGSTNWGHPPVKWRMTPFNDDWPSSLFLSQDPVAIESVGFDFLFYEFDENHPTEGGTPTGNSGPFPHFAGTDDYLRQAADAANWPPGLVYDPDGDGTPLPSSMGAHEHWNNASEKKYSRNLGLDTGIELVTIEGSTHVENPEVEQTGVVTDFVLSQNYPNPFNPDTRIQYQLSSPGHITLAVFQVNGQQIRLLYQGYQ
ncbi:DUF362 domain-containing protein, partial [candidate division KSB1 bacterium]|nr:DUF362 domain-containing protein [candidate division KSB1 bacterium]